MYTDTEKTVIKWGAKDRFIKLISKALQKDRIGCESSCHWTLAFHIYSILKILGRSLTDIKENSLYEKLIEYKTKPLS